MGVFSMKSNMLRALSWILCSVVLIPLQVDKEAVHIIDEILRKRITIVSAKVAEGNALEEKYRSVVQILDPIEWAMQYGKYLSEKRELLSITKREIDNCLADVTILATKRTPTGSGRELVTKFTQYFSAYKAFLNALLINMESQILAAKLGYLINAIELNQQKTFDAFDASSIGAAEVCYKKEAELLEAYKGILTKIDLGKDFPLETKNLFIETYGAMHQEMRKYIEAYKINYETYKKARLKDWGLLITIPYEKSAAFQKKISEILFVSDPKIHILEQKSAQAGRDAYTLYYLQKKQLAENPVIID
jgi:hypothetical protein